ncbi:MAG: hemerythrin domain-containing protein [Ardenticatenales bacterium]|nr:hemerythrin domain-containing protein [Ardenticatenales bacterium]
MKRHPALQPLSREHHSLLHHAREIRWAVEGTPHASPVGEVIQAFLDDWYQVALAHFQEEEEILLPLATEQALATRIRAEHEWLRHEVARLAQEVEQQEAPYERARRIAQGLHDHIRFEERVFFQQLQALLPDAELLELGARSRLFRAHRHSP